jgi:hypothetical protein
VLDKWLLDQELWRTWQAARAVADHVAELWHLWSLVSGGQALALNRSPPATRELRPIWIAAATCVAVRSRHREPGPGVSGRRPPSVASVGSCAIDTAFCDKSLTEIDVATRGRVVWGYTTEGKRVLLAVRLGQADYHRNELHPAFQHSSDATALRSQEPYLIEPTRVCPRVQRCESSVREVL